MSTVSLLHKAASLLYRVSRKGRALLMWLEGARVAVPNKTVRGLLCAGAGCLGLLVLPQGQAQGAPTYTVNVQLSTAAANPVQLQAGIISGLTNQYLSTLTANPAFPGTYTLKVFGPNPAYTPPQPPAELVTLDNITRKLTKISTWTYVYGWADGEDYQRTLDMGIMSDFILNCSTASYFGASSTTWSPGTCGTALMAAQIDVYNQQFSTPTLIIPGGL